LESWLRGEIEEGVYYGRVKASFRGTHNQEFDAKPDTLAKLFIQGASVDWTQLDEGRKLRRATLPTYPFQRERCWFEERSPDCAPHVSVASMTGASAESAFLSQNLRDRIEAAPSEERLEMIQLYLKDQVAKVIGLESPDSVDESRPLGELGMDSLMALELKNELQQSSGIKLPANFMFKYPTIAGAATYLNAVIGSANGGSRGASSEYEDVSI